MKWMMISFEFRHHHFWVYGESQSISL